MTITTTNAKKVYTANGSTTVFGWDFYVPNSASLIVNKTALDGTLSTLTLGADYTVSGLGTSTGSVTILGSPLASGILVTLQRSVPLLQSTDLTNQDGFYPEVIEAAFDLLTMMVQQNTEAIGRAIKSPISDTGTLTMPTAASRASKILGFDGSGNPVPSGNVSDLTNLSAAVSAASTSATAAASARDAALAALTNFRDQYIGASATAPTQNADGTALAGGELYFNSSNQQMFVYAIGTGWINAYGSGATFLAKTNNLSDLANAATARTNLGLTAAATTAIGGAGGLVALDGSAKLPAVDGSQLLNVGGKLIKTNYAEYTAWAAMTTIIPFDDTIPQNTEGTQLLTITVTTTTATQKVRLRAQAWAFSSTGSIQVILALFRNGNANAIAANADQGAAVALPYYIEFEDAPGAAGTYTYTVRIGPSSAASVYVNGNATSRMLGGSSRATLIADVVEV